MPVAARGFAAVAALVAAGLAAPPALAGGFTISTMGGRRSGSLANLAFADDATALFHNPAGLAQQKGLKLHLSNVFYVLRTDFELKALDPALYPSIDDPRCGTAGQPACRWPIDDQGYYRQSIEPESFLGTIPYIGVSSDLGAFGPAWRDLVVGAALYLPAFYGGSLPAAAPSRYFMIDGSFLVGAATVGVGWSLHPRIAVGANVSYTFMRLATKRDLSTVASLAETSGEPSPIGRAAQAMLGDLTLDYVGTDHGFSWGAGVLLRPTGWLAIGVSYVGYTKARFVGEVGLRSEKADAQRLEDLFRTFGYKVPRELLVEMPVPHSLSAGIALMPARWLDIGVDLRTWHYQVFERQLMRPIYDPADEGEPPMTEESLSQDKNYTLSYEIAAGIVLRPFARHPLLELMLGASYDRSPIPDETFTMENPSLSSVNVSTGARWRFSPRWRASLTFLVYIYLERDIRTSQTAPPNDGRGTGTAYLPGFEVEHTF